jgi:hypothetical protein
MGKHGFESRGHRIWVIASQLETRVRPVGVKPSPLSQTPTPYEKSLWLRSLIPAPKPTARETRLRNKFALGGMTEAAKKKLEREVKARRERDDPGEEGSE